MDVRTARFLLGYAALTAAADVADHWVQTDAQATTKGQPGWSGRLACARHVATHTLTQAAAVVGAARWLRVPLRPAATAAALALSAVTHYAADRRDPLRALALATGHRPFYTLAAGGLNGAYLMDQAWHHGWNTVAALVLAGRRQS